MGFWSDLFNRDPSPTADYNPGDPDGVEVEGEATESRALPKVLPSPWSGWPAEWNVPNWDFGSRFNELVDIAWACLDLNSRVLSSMPVYRTRHGETVDAKTWMSNPDPDIYQSWNEFAKQLFWDYQLGEAFVLPMARFADDSPMRFRVVPPWMVDVEIRGGGRIYRLGGPGGTDVTEDILHIRYKSVSTSPRGVGPLESAGGRMLTAGVLAKYIRDLASTGGVPDYTLETDAHLEPEEAADLKHQWVVKRLEPGPPLLDSGVKLKTHFAMSPKDMAMLELGQFTESRIAVLLGVPPFLVGLPSTSGDSLTYSNVISLFDFHDRAGLRTFAADVMAALSNWALPSGQRAELNRDEYSRPAFNERADAYVKLVDAGIMSVDEVRRAERLTGSAPSSDSESPNLAETILASGNGKVRAAEELNYERT